MTRHLIFHNQLCTIIVVAIALATNHCSCEARHRRQELNAFATLQKDIKMMDKVLAGANEERLYEANKYEPNYFARFPSLGELVQPNSAADDIETLDNSLLLQRLRDLTDNDVDADVLRDENYAMLINEIDFGGQNNDNANIVKDNMPAKALTPNNPAKKYATTYKSHGIKKNIQYMTPCHFKICNMGRKRNARQFLGY